MRLFIFSIFIISLFTSCATRPNPLPESHAFKLPWGAIDLDVNSESTYSIKNSLGSILTQKEASYKDLNQSIPFDILTLTGGGSRGAFGTGILLGWTDKGDIPSFDIITGISTGAVMAPFIFLGGEELKKVKYFYTKVHTQEVFTSTWTRFFSDGYIMNAEPLKNLFKENFNKEFLDKVAEQHSKGRRLYIGTTNIDTGQLIVWDMGAIASSNREDKYQRFADIIYASSALPIYLPPQYMSVDIEGEDYYQMHIDGGIYSQVFMIGLNINWTKVLNLRKNAHTSFDVTLYTVANRKYRQRDLYKPVKQKPFEIIEAYVLTEMDLLFDRSMYRLYQSCQKKNIKFRMVSIPDKIEDIVDVPTEFNPEKMTQLFNVGYHLGITEIPFQNHISISEYDDNQ